MEKQDSSGKWLTTQQVADIIGAVKAKTIARWCEEKILPCAKVRERWYIHKVRLLRMLDKLNWPRNNNQS